MDVHLSLAFFYAGLGFSVGVRSLVELEDFDWSLRFFLTPFSIKLPAKLCCLGDFILACHEAVLCVAEAAL